MIRRTLIAACILLLVACASSPSGSGSNRYSNVISADEITAVTATNAAEIVRQLRPNWLRSRGPGSIRGGVPEVPIIYVDEVRSSDPNALEHIASQIVFEIRYLSGRDATTLYGMNHGGGAILVRTRR